eukprot:gene5710-4073_t
MTITYTSSFLHPTYLMNNILDYNAPFTTIRSAQRIRNYLSYLLCESASRERHFCTASCMSSSPSRNGSTYSYSYAEREREREEHESICFNMGIMDRCIHPIQHSRILRLINATPLSIGEATDMSPRHCAAAIPRESSLMPSLSLFLAVESFFFLLLLFLAPTRTYFNPPLPIPPHCILIPSAQQVHTPPPPTKVLSETILSFCCRQGAYPTKYCSIAALAESLVEVSVVICVVYLLFGSCSPSRASPAATGRRYRATVLLSLRCSGDHRRKGEKKQRQQLKEKKTKENKRAFSLSLFLFSIFIGLLILFFLLFLSCCAASAFLKAPHGVHRPPIRCLRQLTVAQGTPKHRARATNATGAEKATPSRRRLGGNKAKQADSEVREHEKAEGVGFQLEFLSLPIYFLCSFFNYYCYFVIIIIIIIIFAFPESSVSCVSSLLFTFCVLFVFFGPLSPLYPTTIPPPLLRRFGKGSANGLSSLLFFTSSVWRSFPCYSTNKIIGKSVSERHKNNICHSVLLLSLAGGSVRQTFVDCLEFGCFIFLFYYRYADVAAYNIYIYILDTTLILLFFLFSFVLFLCCYQRGCVAQLSPPPLLLRPPCVSLLLSFSLFDFIHLPTSAVVAASHPADFPTNTHTQGRCYANPQRPPFSGACDPNATASLCPREPLSHLKAMGASPSRESTPLFSYFRGSYETGLIPLTQHFFGADENHAAQGSGSFGPQRPGKAFASALQLKDRQELRRQLLQVRADPAILYSMARDKQTMRRTMLTKLRQRLKEVRQGQKDGKMHNNSSDMYSEDVGVSSSFNTPPTSQHSPTEGNAQTVSLGVPLELNKSEDALLRAIDDEDGAQETTDLGPAGGAHACSEEEEIAQLLEELGIGAAEAETFWQHSFWDVIPESNCTEEDLDRFLSLVDKRMYPTDRDMAISSADMANYPPVYAPVPCALCLAYPPAKAREGCFLLEGRFINIIGFFGCLTPEMQQAFKITKSDADAVQAVQTDLPRSAGTPASQAEHQRSSVLYLSTAILTSAGDRTLERVLALAAVMLRQQFHTASRRVLLVQQRRKEQEASAGAGQWMDTNNTNSAGGGSPEVSDAEEQMIFLTPLPSPPAGMFLLNQRSPQDDGDAADPAKLGAGMSQAKALAGPMHLYGTTPTQRTAPTLFTEEDENEITWNYHHRLRQLSVVIHTASNNYSALKSLTENLAFLHCQLRIDPSESSMALLHLPEESEKPPSVIKAEAAAAEAAASTESEAAGETPSKSATGSAQADAAPTKDGEERSSSTNSRVAARSQRTFHLPPSSLIVLHLTPQHFCQAALWASGLLHFPQMKGLWIQYKLKDEAEALRQTLQRKDELIAEWRRRDRVASTSYLGPLTPRLLAHVRCLQEETEHARSLQPEHWARQLHVDKDGRKYALHPSPYGTMLIGVRSKTANPPATAASSSGAGTERSHGQASTRHARVSPPAGNAPGRWHAEAYHPHPPPGHGKADNGSAARHGHRKNTGGGGQELPHGSPLHLSYPPPGGTQRSGGYVVSPASIRRASSGAMASHPSRGMLQMMVNPQGMPAQPGMWTQPQPPYMDVHQAPPQGTFSITSAPPPPPPGFQYIFTADPSKLGQPQPQVLTGLAPGSSPPVAPQGYAIATPIQTTAGGFCATPHNNPGIPMQARQLRGSFSNTHWISNPAPELGTFQQQQQQQQSPQLPVSPFFLDANGNLCQVQLQMTDPNNFSMAQHGDASHGMQLPPNPQRAAPPNAVRLFLPTQAGNQSSPQLLTPLSSTGPSPISFAQHEPSLTPTMPSGATDGRGGDASASASSVLYGYSTPPAMGPSRKSSQQGMGPDNSNPHLTPSPFSTTQAQQSLSQQRTVPLLHSTALMKRNVQHRGTCEEDRTPHLPAILYLLRQDRDLNLHPPPKKMHSSANEVPAHNVRHRKIKDDEYTGTKRKRNERYEKQNRKRKKNNQQRSEVFVVPEKSINTYLCITSVAGVFLSIEEGNTKENKYANARSVRWGGRITTNANKADFSPAE